MFKPEEDLSERVIFPVTRSQSNGIEDARFVKFSDGDREIYYATYTAYSGRAIRSGIDRDHRLHVVSTNAFARGCRTGNKGSTGAVPAQDRRHNYAMIARQDNENLYLIFSNDLYDVGRGAESPF